jgi:NADH:ubiquinone oxidoreductase subunit E
MGRHLIVVCRGLDCYRLGGQMIEEAIEDELGIGRRRTTADGLHTVESTDCLAMCEKGPALKVDDDLYGPVHPDSIRRILRSYR